MKSKIIGKTNSKFDTPLELESEQQFTFFTTPEAMSACLNPKELLQVRDWINERVRELQFLGYLQDHIGD